MDTEHFFEELWLDYIKVTPQADKIHQALLKKESKLHHIINDHVAFRTFNHPLIDLKKLEKPLLALGYQPFEPYIFENKHLKAWGYIPENPKHPRVFLSELLVEDLSLDAQNIIDSLCKQIPKNFSIAPSIFYAGLLWNLPRYDDYQVLISESEYAGWLSVMGFRANHFTVSVNHLTFTDQLEDVLNEVETAGLQLNLQGGKIKGNKDVLLEQGSTLADRKVIRFACGHEQEIPTCFYEFAKRYPDQQGNLYQGFVAASADKIFESTDQR